MTKGKTNTPFTHDLCLISIKRYKNIIIQAKKDNDSYKLETAGYLKAIVRNIISVLCMKNPNKPKTKPKIPSLSFWLIKKRKKTKAAAR
jgi:hypothetical protein